MCIRDRQCALLTMLVASAHAGQQSAVTVDWVSSPLRPDEIAMVSGDGFSPSSRVTLTSTDGSSLNPSAFDVSPSSLKFLMPKAAHTTAYDLTIDDSVPLPVNLPEVWWWQGDQGNVSSPGGWLRVFGRNMAPPQPTTSRAGLETQLIKATRDQLYQEAGQILRQIAAIPNTESPQLRLVSGQTVVTLNATNATEFDALFEIPATLSAGSYTGQICSGQSTRLEAGWVSLSMFDSPTSPHKREIIVAPPRVWKAEVFTVDCEWDKPIWDRLCGWVGARSEQQVAAALAAARSNGGGTVILPACLLYTSPSPRDS
eukprot:TRINITY_DN8200_c0_g1_i1.p1 TRINITY_DN8200_c0_g1~~TRINITY_DN8200_c0_g1_i1.p1  ORF type:complete len:314 (-),score=66.34 TRINITY_DN8200_c0_g1_i1:116-1057(-)